MAKKDNRILHLCGSCANVEEVTAFHTLSVHDRKPTLGRCPFWKESKSLILSQEIECNYYKPRI